MTEELSQQTPQALAPESATSTLDALAEEYWHARLTASPIEATLLGDRRFDDRMPDVTQEGRARHEERLRAMLARVRAIDKASLSPIEQVTQRALDGEIENDLALLFCRMDEWSADPRTGPQVDLLTLAHLQTVSTPEQGEALLERWRRAGDYLDQQIQNMQRWRGEGRTAVRGAVVRVMAQIDAMLAQPDDEWVLMAPRNTPHPDWPTHAQEAMRGGVDRAVRDVLRPAFQRYREALATEVLASARDGRDAGISAISGGAECYEKLIRVHTSLELSPEEIHRIGLDEIAKIRSEMQEIGERALGTRDLDVIKKRLRADPSLYFTTRDEVEDKAKEALARATVAFPKWVGRVPKTPCTVQRIEAYEEKECTIAYYRPPAADGSRGGIYFINTYAPETRPRYEAEALAFHEAVPGHHSQIAIAQELTGIPEFRKHAGVTAYVEGWALYTERLADEMGLYSSDLDRMGMLSFDAWRASRLVVDTGIHTMGWTREEAENYMFENTMLARNNIEIEVDRYIVWPGQALAYKIGQLEIFRLRDEATRALGSKLDLRGFHDTLLTSGAVSLPVLRDLVARWISESTPNRA